MRKLILISALLLASASAQAGDTRSLSLTGVDATEPAKPIAEVSMQLAQAAAPAETTAPAQTQAPAATTTTATTTEPKSDTKSADTKTTETKKPVKKVRRESDEQKARRIAARYGVYW